MEVIPMLYLGIDLSDFRVTITALSEGFAFLDELSLCADDASSVGPWLDSLRLNDAEPILWFFCKKKFLAWRGPLFFFDLAGKSHRFFLVKDRVIENLYKMCSDLFCRHRHSPYLEPSYLLAAARGFVDDAHITPYLPSMQNNR